MSPENKTNKEEILEEIRSNFIDIMDGEEPGASKQRAAEEASDAQDPAENSGNGKKKLTERQRWWAENIKFFVYAAEALIFVGVMAFLIHFFAR